MKKINSELPVFYETANAELASALEMLAACKGTYSPKQALGYFMHAKDEYNHARSFFKMTQTSMNTPYAKRVAEKFREAQNYLKTNGFSRSTKHLLEDIENSVEK